MSLRELSDHEKRTIRIGAIGLGIYLALFGASIVWTRLEKMKAGYRARVAEARELRAKILPYEGRIASAEKLMADYHMDPGSLARTSLVAQASSAIQKAASDAGLRPGPIRESASHTGTKEIASIQFEGSGPAPSVLKLLYQIDRLGYPVIVDSVQLSPDNQQPGSVKVNLVIALLGFDEWTEEQEGPHA